MNRANITLEDFLEKTKEEARNVKAKAIAVVIIGENNEPLVDMVFDEHKDLHHMTTVLGSACADRIFNKTVEVDTERGVWPKQ